RSPWRALDPWLQEHATGLELEIAPPEPADQLAEEWVEEAERLAREAAERRAAMGAAGVRRISVTAHVKGTEAGAGPAAGTLEQAGAGSGPSPAVPAPGAGIPERPAAALPAETGGAVERYRGYSWGSAVHGALALAPEE